MYLCKPWPLFSVKMWGSSPSCHSRSSRCCSWQFTSPAQKCCKGALVMLDLFLKRDLVLGVLLIADLILPREHSWRNIQGLLFTRRWILLRRTFHHHQEVDWSRTPHLPRGWTIPRLLFIISQEDLAHWPLDSGCLACQHLDSCHQACHSRSSDFCCHPANQPSHFNHPACYAIHWILAASPATHQIQVTQLNTFQIPAIQLAVQIRFTHIRIVWLRPAVWPLACPRSALSPFRIARPRPRPISLQLILVCHLHPSPLLAENCGRGFPLLERLLQVLMDLPDHLWIPVGHLLACWIGWGDPWMKRDLPLQLKKDLDTWEDHYVPVGQQDQQQQLPVDLGCRLEWETLWSWIPLLWNRGRLKPRRQKGILTDQQSASSYLQLIREMAEDVLKDINDRIASPQSSVQEKKRKLILCVDPRSRWYYCFHGAQSPQYLLLLQYITESSLSHLQSPCRIILHFQNSSQEGNFIN